MKQLVTLRSMVRREAASSSLMGPAHCRITDIGVKHVDTAMLSGHRIHDRLLSEFITSQAKAVAALPSPWMMSTVSWAASRFTSTQTTWAPLRANRTAVALPLPHPDRPSLRRTEPRPCP
jgi:hypothetical protein